MPENNLQLPKTAFSMKANLPSKEPKILESWDKTKLYERLRRNRQEKKNLYFMMVRPMQTAIFIWERLSTKFLKIL